MPELPEVETVKRGLAPVMEGAVCERLEVRRANLRYAFPDNFAQRLKGCTFNTLWRRAKYLLADLSSGETLIMHLGMSGSFRIEVDEATSPDGRFDRVFHHEKSKLASHDHVVFHLATGPGRARVIYNDPRRFGFMELAPTADLQTHRHFRHLGIEPTGNALSSDVLAGLLKGRKVPIKAALLDQRLIAGLGNIYVCEALNRAGISPKRQARTLVLKSGKPSARLLPLAAVIRDVISEAIEAGGSSLRDHRQADGSLGYFQHTFKVYDREGKPCSTPDCGGMIRRIVQSGRSTFYCPSCQR